MNSLSHRLNIPDEWYALNRRGYKKFDNFNFNNW